MLKLLIFDLINKFRAIQLIKKSDLSVYLVNIKEPQLLRNFYKLRDLFLDELDFILNVDLKRSPEFCFLQYSNKVISYFQDCELSIRLSDFLDVVPANLNKLITNIKENKEIKEKRS